MTPNCRQKVIAQFEPLEGWELIKCVVLNCADSIARQVEHAELFRFANNTIQCQFAHGVDVEEIYVTRCCRCAYEIPSGAVEVVQLPRLLVVARLAINVADDDGDEN